MDKFDDGYYNSVMRGYLVVALKYAGFSIADAIKAIGGLWEAMETFSATEAEQITTFDWDEL